jgi:uncharacterized repeat protein (TIGR01451 family)/LPXTG-motif cell wall-anchored protein
MGKLINALKRLPKRTTALIAIVAAAIVVPATLFAWGPDRPTYTINNPADHITFNSITDNPNIGDERNFVGIRENGSNSTWSDNITVQPGKEYVVRMYVHNNAASSLNLVAENVTAKVNLPTNTAKSLQVNGFINSTNASPQEVYDHAVMNSAQDFNLAYQPGTLKYFTNASGANGFNIPESVFTSAGAKLGYDKLDGKIPGCFQYAGYLTFVVKPQFANPSSDFSVNKQVRKDGTGAAFAESTNVMPGDTVNYRIEVKNTGNAAINNVIVKDKLPAGVTLVPGTVEILNANNPGGAYIQDGDKVVTTGVNIGAYSPGSNALVIFNAKVAANDQLPTCGPNKLTNIASAQPEGQNPKEDGADVNVPKECKPEAKYACDALTVTKIERTKFKFETKYTVENATLKGIQYVIRDAQGKEIARQSGSDYTQENVGKYTVEAVLTVTVDGQDKTVTSDACKKPFEVVKENTPGIVIEKKVDGVKQKQVGVDQEFTYQLVVTNTGEVDLTDSVVTDKAPAGVTFIKASAGTITDNAWNYTIASLKVGQSTSFTITAKVPSYIAGSIVNTACVDSPQVPGTPDSCDKATVEVPKPCVPGTDTACTKTPEIPSELPKTGAGDGIIAIIGAGSIIAAIGYYIASRRALSA